MISLAFYDYFFSCRDEKPKIKETQLPIVEQVQCECNIFLWMLNTPVEQTELEPSAQSLAVSPQHKGSGAGGANVQSPMPGFYFLSLCRSVYHQLLATRTVKPMCVCVCVCVDSAEMFSSHLTIPCALDLFLFECVLLFV